MPYTFRFKDNRPITKVSIVLTSAELAKHLVQDEQFVYYWRHNWDPRLQAYRSLYLYPPHPLGPRHKELLVAPELPPEAWEEVDVELEKILGPKLTEEQKKLKGSV